MASGEHTLTAGAPGHFSLSSPRVQLRAGTTLEGVDVVLVGGAVAVAGIVVDAFGGEIEAATVTAWSYGAPRAATASRPDGTFELWVPPGLTDIVGFAQGYAPGELEVGAPVADVVLRLTPESTISGVVVTTDGRAAVGAEVTALGPEVVGTTVSGDAGEFTLTGLHPGRYAVQARGDRLVGRSETTIPLGIAEHVDDLRIVVHAGVRVSGTVLTRPDLRPCKGARVGLSSPDGFSEIALGIDGDIVFPAVPPGAYQVGVDCEGYVSSATADDLVLESDMEGLEWVVDPGLRLTGVVESDGIGIAGATVWATGAVPATVSSGVDGEFAIEGLVAGAYSVAAIVPGFPSPAPVTVEFDVDGGETHVILSVSPGATLRGRVVDGSKTPVTGIHVTAANASVLHGATTVTDEAGQFELTGLPVGEVAVYAHTGAEDPIPLEGAADGKIRLRLAADADDTVELVVAELVGTISGRTLDDAGPVVDAYVLAAFSGLGRGRISSETSPRTSALSDEEGRFALTGLPGGRYDLDAHRQGGAGRAVARDVATGSTVDLRLVPGCSLRGTIGVAGALPARFSVTATSIDARASYAETFMHTDGRWRIPQLEQGTYTVVARADGAASKRTRVECTDVDESIVLELEATGVLRGRLVDAETSEGVAEHLVALAVAGAPFHGVYEGESVVTGPDGAFELTDVAAGAHVVLAVPRAWESAKYPPVRKQVSAVAAKVVQLPTWEVRRLRIPLHEKPGDLGFSLAPAPDGKDPTDVPLTVGVVEPGGPASDGGLRVGDVLTAIDGHDVTGDNWDSYFSLIRVREGTVIALTVEGGEDDILVRARASQ